jgi:hypothetical protein
MKRILILSALLTFALVSFAEEEGVPKKVGDSVKKGGEAAGRGIENGGEAVGRGLKKGADATVKGVKKAGTWAGKKLEKGGEKLEKASQ